jgi:hypothetical protein
VRSVIAGSDRYVTATMAFRDKYLAWPGDMANATSFFGGGACFTNTGSPTVTTNICNGDGDAVTANYAAAAGKPSETLQVWTHMAAAGLVEGTYSGVTGATATNMLAVNVPPGKISNSYWSLTWAGDRTAATTGSAFALNYQNALITSFITPATDPGLLKPEELWNIDTKTDDGMPARGRVVARPWSDCTTAATLTDFNATYNLTNTTAPCQYYRRNLY